MRVAYVGDFGRSWTTETHVADALEAYGFDVVRYPSRATSWARIAKDARSGEFEILFLSARPLVGDQVRGRQILAELNSLGVISVSYHLDIYSGLGRVLDVGVPSWWGADFVFTADGGTDPRFFRSKGVNHHWVSGAIPFAEAYIAAEPDPRFRAKVAFVGARAYHPEWSYRSELIRWLEERYGSDFRVFPEDGERIHGDELNRLYASVDVIVGDSFCPGFDHRNYWSDRIYQTLGRGGVLIHPRIEGLEAHYEAGVHFEEYVFGDLIALASKIDRLLDDEDERAVYRVRGWERTVDAHTYDHRVEEMMTVVGRGLKYRDDSG